MLIVICPGVHPPKLTDRFIEGVQDWLEFDYLVLPTEQYLPYDAIAVSQWLEEQQIPKSQPISFIAFSAGVVGSIGAAIAWQLGGGTVHSFIAFDGWGVPLLANFPIYRVSHDLFTHWSSSILGGRAGFYAEPEVEHLELWRSPAACSGWQIISLGCRTRNTLANYLTNVLNS